MKTKAIGLLIGLAISFSVFSQHRDSLIATKIRPGIFWFFTGLKPSPGIWLPRYDRLMIDIKYNDLVNPSNIKLFNTNWKSIGFNTQFVFDIPMNKHNTAGFGIGFGYQFSKYVHNKAVLPFSGNKYDFQDSSYFKKSILRAHTFFVPVEFRFRTKGWQHFKVHLGSNIGYRFGNNKVYQGNTTTKIRTGKMSNFEWAYLDVHARIGIRNWALLVAVDMLPIFRQTTVKSFPVSLGITLSLF